jgi:hypothetical protein
VTHVKGSTVYERRKLRRFSVRAPALVQAESLGAEKVFELCTKDISSGGAFFPMNMPLPFGEKVKITLFLRVSALERAETNLTRAKVATKGLVVRSTRHGMAVEFDRRYEMSPAASGT